MGKYIIPTLFAFLFAFLAAAPAKAGEVKIEASTDDGVEASTDGVEVDIDSSMDNVDEVVQDYIYEQQAQNRGRRWMDGTFFELGPYINYQFAFPTDADNTGFSGSFATGLDLKFCWSYNSSQDVVGIYGPDFRTGYQLVHSYDEIAGEGIVAHAFTWQPGFYHANYVDDDRWLIYEQLSLFMANIRPGIQLDVGASYIVSDLFNFDFGVALGFYSTNLELANGETVNWFSIGPHFGFNFEAWGKYRPNW